MSEQTVIYRTSDFEDSARTRSYSEDRYVRSLEQKCDELQKQLDMVKNENKELRQALEGAAIIASIVAREIARLRSELESVKRGKEKP